MELFACGSVFRGVQTGSHAASLGPFGPVVANEHTPLSRSRHDVGFDKLGECICPVKSRLLADMAKP